MLVIGNGESRKGVDLNTYYGKKIGCNAIHRDYQVDHLICVDRRMVEEAVTSDVNETAIVYTRHDWIDTYKKTQKVRTVPLLPYKGTERWDEPFQWGSGPYAVLLGATLSTEVKMIGFDLFSETTSVNNIYKDTNGYNESTKNAVDPRYWIHQIGMVFECFPKTQFKILNKHKWLLPKRWNFDNVSLDTLNIL